MRKIVALGAVLLITFSGFAQSKKTTGYQYTVDLTKVVNDRIYVELQTPPISKEEITFYLPKIIPGTYEIADYGRYVQDLQALDKKGNKLAVERVNDNAWKIKTATKLQKITYWVDDVIDTEVAGPKIYPMAATNIEDGKNVVMNTSGFFGYFEDMKNVPFNFNVIRQKDFYGSTALVASQVGAPITKFTKEKGPAADNKV